MTHINNKEDPIPIMPGMSLGYHHPSGEIHIEDSGEWASCPGEFDRGSKQAYTDHHAQVRTTRVLNVRSVMSQTYSNQMKVITTGHMTVSRWGAETTTFSL